MNSENPIQAKYRDEQAERILDALIRRPHLALRLRHQLGQVRFALPWTLTPGLNPKLWVRPQPEGCWAATVTLANESCIYEWTVVPNGKDNEQEGTATTLEVAQSVCDTILLAFHEVHPEAGIRWLFLDRVVLP